MAKNKQAETDIRQIANRYNIWCHKWQDVRYCPHCHRPIFVTNRMSGNDEQKESIVDFMMVTNSALHWIEAKGKGDHNRFPFKELESHQRQFMNSFHERGVPCWLYLTLGNGKRAPGGRKAWFISWEAYREAEALMVLQGMKSLSWIPTNRKVDVYDMTHFENFELYWNHGGWEIPMFHPMWKYVEGLDPLS